jgi:4-hydroxyproline epimerase
VSRIAVVDSHTAGEPTRVVVAGGPDLGTGPMADRRSRLAADPGFWRAVVREPRGSAVLVAALVCEPVDPAAACGVIFWNTAGMLGMCGHGTIGLVETLRHLGRLGPGAHRIETPVGDITATLHPDGRVSVRNVLSYVARAGLTADGLTGDIAWGGNWFFVADAPGPVGLTDVDALTARCWAVRRALAAAGLPEIDHIELCGPPADPTNDSRNFVLCPGGAYDRSPCGTGTSAKLACLAAAGELAPGEVWRQEGLAGGVFEASYEPAPGGVLPTVTGRAWVTAEATLLRLPDDPLRDGL